MSEHRARVKEIEKMNPTSSPVSKPVNPKIPGIRQDVPQAAAGWLDPIAWKTFATLEFQWSTRSETANSKFAQLVNNMEKKLRTPVCYVACLESRSKSGGSVPNHFHAAFTCAREIPAELIRSEWASLIGRTADNGGDLTLVEPYDRQRNGIGYITKMASDHGCEWSFKNLHRFNPDIVMAPAIDGKAARQARRLARRFEAQSAAA